MVDERSRLTIDLSANAPDGVRNSGVARAMLASFPGLRPLLLVLKTFVQQHGLHKTKDGGLGSYCLFVMAQMVARQCAALDITWMPAKRSWAMQVPGGRGGRNPVVL